MKILITGGAGFIGSHLIKKLLAMDYEIVCVDDFNNFYPSKIKEYNVAPFLNHHGFTLYKGDITDYEFLKTIIKKTRPRRIAHLAARAGVRPSIQNPFIYQHVNIGGTLNLLQLAKEYAIEHFLLTSSSSVYGDRSRVPFSENDPINAPISPYAATKRSTELLAYTYHHLYGLSINVIRPFTIYGPAGRPDMAPFLFTRIIDREEPIKKFGDGTSKRDYTYIDDFVGGAVVALERKFGYEIFNLGNSKPIELNYFILIIEKNLNKKAKIRHLSNQPGDVRITYADISKAKRMLGYNPKTSIEEGMKKFIDWYKRNKVLYKSL